MENKMNFLEKITGIDISNAMNNFDERIKLLPIEYQTCWMQIKDTLWNYTDFTGRNLLPIFNDIIELLEVAAAENQSINDIFGDDIEGFCTEFITSEGLKTRRDRWRNQLNKNVMKKLGALK